MKSKNLLLPFSVAFLLALAIPSEAGYLPVTLAGISPGETTTEEFITYLKEHSCDYSTKDGITTIQPGCFQLPRNPVMTVGPGFEGKADVIGEINLAFPNDRNNNFEAYFEKLTSKYGKPSYTYAGLDQLIATWRLPDQSYILVADNNAHTATLFMGNDVTFRYVLKTKYPEAYKTVDLDDI
ncbi:MAG: hypothetical protein LUC43_03820 [Burkholderiales bacterium]|nr:hypothetical protein [Burkholderiales bacterium]